MGKIDVDLAGSKPRGEYADGAETLARQAIAKRAVLLSDDRKTARITSPRSGGTYRLGLVWVDGEVEGITCTCPHGKNNPRAWCWHALTVEKLVERYGAKPPAAKKPKALPLHSPRHGARKV